jgi:hypothetical protein
MNPAYLWFSSFKVAYYGSQNQDYVPLESILCEVVPVQHWKVLLQLADDEKSESQLFKVISIQDLSVYCGNAFVCVLIFGFHHHCLVLAWLGFQCV